MGDNKINNVEAFFILAFVFLIEIMEVVLSFMLVFGDIIKLFANTIVWLTVQFWLTMKGARGQYYTIACLVEYIPLLNALPAKTAALALTIYLHNKQVDQ